jgi:aerobic carbon-monoxide dehydrogenase small subunit
MPESDAGMQTIEITLTLNGAPVTLTVEPRELLLDVLRDRLGLTGAKRSCDVEVCGTCTVLVDERPVSACTTLAFEVRGRSVVTIEGLAVNGRLDPVQRAFLECGALQCGYCTPGMILATRALVHESPDADDAEIRRFLRGNLCRCTGYVKIREAVRQALEEARRS